MLYISDDPRAPFKAIVHNAYCGPRVTGAFYVLPNTHAVQAIYFGVRCVQPTYDVFPEPGPLVGRVPFLDSDFTLEEYDGQLTINGLYKYFRLPGFSHLQATTLSYERVAYAEVICHTDALGTLVIATIRGDGEPATKLYRQGRLVENVRVRKRDGVVGAPIYTFAMNDGIGKSYWVSLSMGNCTLDGEQLEDLPVDQYNLTTLGMGDEEIELTALW